MGSAGLASKGDEGSGTVAGSGWEQRVKGEGMVMKGGGRGVRILSFGEGGTCGILL